MSEFVPDKDFLKRVRRAPWVSSAANQEPSALLRRNRNAIAFNQSRPSSETGFRKLYDTGWFDYLQTYQNLDMFSDGFAGSMPVVIDGVIYSCISNDMYSFYNVKFFKMYGTIPYLFRFTPRGYDYLLLFEKSFETLDVVMDRRYGNMLKAIKVTEDGKSLKISIDRKEITQNPLILNAVSLFRDRMHEYEALMELAVLTDNMTGRESVVAIPTTAYEDVRIVANSMSRQILPIPDDNGDMNYELLSTLFKDLPGTVTGSFFFPQRRVAQYSLPEIQSEDVHLILHYFHEKFPGGWDMYLDIYACLSSRRLLRTLYESKRKDHLTFFVENMDSSTPYVRYSSSQLKSNDGILHNLEHYQSVYNGLSSPAINSVAGKGEPGIYLSSADTNKEAATRPQRIRRVDRELDIITRRIGMLVANSMSRQILPISEGYESIGHLWYRVKKDALRYGIHRDDMTDINLLISFEEWLTKNNLPNLGKMVENIDDIYEDYKEVEYLRPVEHANMYISIHGVSFKSEEIVRLFYNTPIAGAVQSGSLEYDPSWLSYKDVRLVADFLSGRVMPYTYYIEMSDEAHIHLSDRDTFFYLSYNNELDSGFVLGERLVDYLGGLKQSDTYQKLSNKTKILLSLF